MSHFDEACTAVQAALDAGARYADARVMLRRSESMTARDGEVEELSSLESAGLGVRALVGSSWGFYAVPDLSEAAENPELETEAVRSSRLDFFCAARHPLAGRNSVTLEEICEFPWVGPTVTGRMRRFLPQGDLPFGVFDEVKNRFLPRILIGNFSAAKHIVLAGQGIGAALPFQLKREIDDGDCVLLPLELPWLSLNYGFISKRGRTHSPAAKAFMDNVRQIEKELPA